MAISTYQGAATLAGQEIRSVSAFGARCVREKVALRDKPSPIQRATGPESSRRRRAIDDPPHRVGDLKPSQVADMEDDLGCHKVL